MNWEEFLKGLAALHLDGARVVEIVLGAIAVWRAPEFIRASGEVVQKHREVSHKHKRALHSRDKALAERAKALAREPTQALPAPKRSSGT